MTSQSKCCPFSCTVFYEPKNPQLPYYEKVQHPNEKSVAKKKVIREKAKVYSRKKIGALIRANFGLNFKSPKQRNWKSNHLEVDKFDSYDEIVTRK